MNGGFNPSSNFVETVMVRVRAYEAQRVGVMERLFLSRPLRVALAGGSTVFGILKAVPVF